MPIVDYQKIIQDKIKKYSKQFKWLPTKNIFFKDKINLNSRTDGYRCISDYRLFTTPNTIKYDKLDDDNYYTKQILLLLTYDQQLVVDKWFDMYILAYNATIKVIKTCIFNDTKVPNITDLKKQLAQEKKDIHDKSKINVKVDGKYRDVYVDLHVLDYAINDARKAYTQCVSNKTNGNIKTFRLRYLKLSKPNKIIKIEKYGVQEKTFCSGSFGKEIKCGIKNFNYATNFHTTATIKKRGSKYYLLLKYPVKKKDIDNDNNLGSFDPGVFPLLTGYCSDEIIRIGINIGNKIKKTLLLIDKRNRRRDISKAKKRKYERKKRKKLKDMVTDMQFKIANYLTKSYDNILIGNWSTKKTGELKGNKMSKRIANVLSIYKLKQKIKYYCNKRHVNYKEVDERLSTKSCGDCSNIKWNLGANKVYKCDVCKLIVDRDVNSARTQVMIALPK